jgi:hypothetical protein
MQESAIFAVYTARASDRTTGMDLLFRALVSIGAYIRYHLANDCPLINGRSAAFLR